MTRERAALNFDLSEFQPKAPTNVISPKEIEKLAVDAGFTARHAPAKENKPVKEVVKVKPAKIIDGRTIRKSQKTTQLNIAVTPEIKNRFWQLADQLDLDSGGDILAHLIALVEEQGGSVD